MATSQMSGPSRMGCAHCATCSCRQRKRPDSDSDSQSESGIESILSPSLSHDNYDPEVWSLSHSISTMNSSDVDIGDNLLSGVGLSVGKAMFAFGRVELRVVEWLWARYRRAIIQRALSRGIGHLERGTDRILDDLVAFQQPEIYGVKLVGWSRDTLFNQIKLGLGHEVVRALHRAPMTLSMHALNNIYTEAQFCIWSKRLLDAMAQFTDGWLTGRYANETISYHYPRIVSYTLTSVAIYGLGEQQLHKRIRGSMQIDYNILYEFTTHVSPERIAASQMLRRLEYLLGRDDPHYIAVEYLIQGNHVRDGMDDDALCRRALSTCLRLHQLHSYQSQEESENHCSVGPVYGVTSTLKGRGRWMEEEVFQRFCVAVNTHVYRVPIRASDLRCAFWRLEEILHERGRHSEADQCHKFNNPLQAIAYPPSPITSPRKARRLSRMRRLCGWRRSHNEAAREEEALIEDLEQLWAEFNPQNDSFLRNIAAGLDEEAQEYLWEITDAKRSSGNDDFHTAHECSSDCEHDYGSEDEGAEENESNQDDDEGMDNEALKNDAVSTVEIAAVEATDNGNEQPHEQEAM